MLKLKEIILSILVLLLSGCASYNLDDRPRVAVTILPQKYLLDRIVGDSIEVVCVVPEGDNPEEYSAVPSQMKKITSSSLYFKVGELGFEKTMLPSILQNAPNIEVVMLSQDLDFISSTCFHNGEEHLHHDPHYWTSPNGAKLMATNMYNAIIKFDSTNSIYYTKNYRELIEELDALDMMVDSLLKEIPNREFAIFHPSLSYFARDYDLRQLTLEEMGKEITPKSMLKAIEEAIEEDVKIVFVQNEFSPEQVKTFAQEIEAKVVVINPLAYNFVEEIKKVAYAIAK